MSRKKDNSCCAKKTSIGGQALMEGIMMRGPEKQAIVVRDQEGNLVEMTYCTSSGELAGSSCDETATGWYKPSNTPGTCIKCLTSIDSEEGWVGIRDEDDETEDELSFWEELFGR